MVFNVIAMVVVIFGVVFVAVVCVVALLIPRTPLPNAANTQYGRSKMNPRNCLFFWGAVADVLRA